MTAVSQPRRRTVAPSLSPVTNGAAALGSTLLVHLVVPGEPVPKARPRVVRTGTYTPARTRAAETRLLEYLKAHYPHLQPVSGPVSVSVTCWLKGNRRADCDNLLKLPLDAFNGVVWLDDSQVVEAYIRKYTGTSIARTEITVHMLHTETVA